MEKPDKFYNCLLILVLLLTFASCSRQKEEKDILSEAEKIVEQQPDSALRLLNTVLFPEKLNKRRFNHYNLLLLQAKDKCDKDITSDTIIFSVKEYYVRKKDYPNAARAAFYCGRVRHEQENMDEAVKAYGEAEKWADKTDDYNLKGLIQGNLGMLHYKYSSYEKAIELNKKAVEMYDKAENYRNKINTLELVGNCFVLSGKIDSAFYYYNESLKLADSCNLPEQQSDVRQNMGVACRQQKNYDRAIKLFNEALAFPNDSTEQARILLNIAKVYVLEENSDSVNFYLDKALMLPISNPWLMRSSYFLKSETEEKNKRYTEALKYYKEYYKSTVDVFDSEKNNKLLEIQEKYDFEKLRNLKKMSELKHLKVLTILSLSLLVAGLIIFVFYRKSVQNKRLLLETKQKVNKLQKIAQRLSREKQTLLDTSFQHLNVIKKTFLIESEIPNDERKNGEKLLKKFNKIVYGQDTFNLNQLYLILNSLHNNVFDEIKEKYPEWTETEFHIFCFSYKSMFNDNEIAVILNKTVPMIRKIRNKIRKDVGTPKYSRDFHAVISE